MRTTILVDDHLGKAFQQAARKKGISLSAFLIQAGRLFLAKDKPHSKPFHLVTHGGAGVRPGVNLDRIREQVVRDDQTTFGSAP
ncbi:MAG: hypothetical protein NTZ01_00865 [Verrucomicrobia bacterium]|nr:hypothetical protein [Verrucomicrobiota bacterium]